MCRKQLYRKFAVSALGLALLFLPPVNASEQASHAEFLRAQKAYIDAVNRRADSAELNRLAEELKKARSGYEQNSRIVQPTLQTERSVETIDSPDNSATDDAETNSVKKSPFRFLTQIRDKIGFAANQLRKLSRFEAFFVQKKLKNSKVEELEKLARERKNFGWHRDDSIEGVVNAHYTNTFSELKKALSSSCNWFECDVRLEGPLRSILPVIGGERRPVTAHDPFQTNGLLFDDWVRIVAASGRGIKVDLKTDDALDGTLAILKKHQIDDKKLIMNINVTAPGKGSLAGEDERLKKIRNEFPECYIKLSPGSGSSSNGKYTDAAVERLIEYSKACGRPVLYALRAEWVTPEIVKKLEQHGKVSIWNTTWSFNPKDIKKEVERFRSWGVTGIVDLMSTLDNSEDH